VLHPVRLKASLLLRLQGGPAKSAGCLEAVKLSPTVELLPNRRLLRREIVRNEMEDSSLEVKRVVWTDVRGRAVTIDKERVLHASLRTTVLVLVIEVVLIDPPLVLHIDASLLHSQQFPLRADLWLA